MTAPAPHDDLLALPAPHGARLVALERLDEAEAARTRLDDPQDAEALHDFRVALRRLRSWLRSYDDVLRDSLSKKAMRRLKAVAAATSESRDLEVHLAWLAAEHASLSLRQRLGAAWMRERLEAQRQEADESLHVELAEDFERVRRRLTRTLESYETTVHLREPSRDPRFATVAASLIETAASELRHALFAVHAAADRDEAHDARIAGKRLRYLIEPLVPLLASAQPVVDDLKQLQDALGDHHDAHVFALELAAALEEAAEEHEQLPPAAASAPAPVASASVARPRRQRRKRDPRPGLLALTEHLRARGEAAFDEVRTQWLGDASSEFFARVAAFASELGASATAGLEIERKFLLGALPDSARDVVPLEIDQGYIPGDALAERLRRVRSADGERYFRTIKHGRGLSRIEIEEETSAEIFDGMWPLTLGRRLQKRRHLVTDGALTWEIDDFADRELVLAEVELPDETATAEPPAWLASHIVREVTDESEYANINLAR